MSNLKTTNGFLLGIVVALLLGACSGNSSQVESPPADKNDAAFANLERDSAPYTATFKAEGCNSEYFDLVSCDLKVIRLTPTEARVRNESVHSDKANSLNTTTKVVECTYTLEGDSYSYFSGSWSSNFAGPWSEYMPETFFTLDNGLYGSGDRACPGSFAP